MQVRFALLDRFMLLLAIDKPAPGASDVSQL